MNHEFCTRCKHPMLRSYTKCTRCGAARKTENSPFFVALSMGLLVSLVLVYQFVH